MKSNMDTQEEARKKIGRILSEARSQRKLTIDDAVEGTSIRASYIKSMENGDFDHLPGGFYVKGYIKSYSEFLELNSEDILRQLENANHQKEKSGKEERIKIESGDARKSPGGAIIALSVLTAISLYIIWASNAPRPVPPVDKNAEKIIETLTKRIYPVDIIAAKDVNILIVDSQNSIVYEAAMKQGDSYLLPEKEGLILKSNDLGAIEIYLDGDKVESFDNLEKKDNGLILDRTKMLANLKITQP